MAAVACALLALSSCGWHSSETAEPPAAPKHAAAPVAAELQPPQNLTPTATPQPILLPGTGKMVQTPPQQHVEPAAEDGDGEVRMNFVNADIRDVAHSVLGDLLHLNYTIDAKLQASVTVQTSRALRRDEVLPVFAEVLRADGLALVRSGDLYRIVALDDAVHSGTPAVVLGSGGNETAAASAVSEVHVLPLRYVSATEVERVVDPLLPPGAALAPDAARNLLLLTGPSQDVRAVVDMITALDVDLLSGMSFGIFPLETGTPRAVVGELNTIFGPGGSVPLPNVIHFAPLDAMNAVLVVSPQRHYVDEAGAWIARLDKGEDDNRPRVFEYYVQNSRAADLAKVLSQLLAPGAVQTVQPTISATAQSIQSGAASTNAPSALVAGGTSPGLPQGGAAIAPMGSLPGLPQNAAPGLPQPGAGTPAAAGQPAENGGSAGAPESPGSSLAAALQTALGGGAEAANAPLLPSVRIVADEKNNALLIYARASDYRMIEDAIRKLDVVPLQVMIEATIAEVTLNNDLQYGLQYYFTHANNAVELSTAMTGVGTVADIAGTFPGFNYFFGTPNNKAVLSALSQLTHVNVVSAPELLVLDHQTAALQVGDEVPVISQTAQSVVTTESPIVNSVEYLNTGVILQVTPRVNSSGLITLDIDQAVSDVSTTTTSTINSPTITQRRIVTSAIVQDGETIALGGLILDTQTNDKSGIPLLQSIPLLGTLFSTTTHNRDRTELLVLLTPKIIRNATQARTMSEELRRRLESIGVLDLQYH
jgi:general secretion pathway protein D